MRLKKIKTHEEANRFLEKEYLPEHNRRFRRSPAQPEDYHRAAPKAAELEEVFHLETVRVIGNDWVVRHDNRYFQVKAQARQYAPAKGKVTVWEWEDGRLQIRYRGRAVAWEEIPGPVPVQVVRASETRNARLHRPSSGSSLAAGLSQDAPVGQTNDPGAAGHRYGCAFRFALSRLRNLDHRISGGANWRPPEKP